MSGYGKSKNGSSSGKGKGKGKGGEGKGRGKGYAENWDAAQLRSLASGKPRTPEDLARPRPQRRVEAFPHLTVCADWPEDRPPRSGSAFYLPLIWSALLPPPGETSAEGDLATQQLASLGDAKHFHGGAARRSTLEDVHKARVYWRQVFSGWDDWVRRMREAMKSFTAPCGQKGLPGIVAAHVQTTSVTAGALIYGDLGALGALPHISNARRAPDQDAILELNFEVRMEIEASVHTLFLKGGDVIPASPSHDPDQSVASPGATVEVGSTQAGSVPVEGREDKEAMKLKKKMREINKLKQQPPETLDVLQQQKLQGEAEILARLKQLEGTDDPEV